MSKSLTVANVSHSTVLFDEAISKASQLDKHFTTTGELVGPLHGVPFSIKDHMLVKGTRATVGFTAWMTEEPVSRISASIVRIYESLGAIPLCKTNIPQTMLSFESSNPLWGRTLNPHQHGHACGGSSGGEAALLASDGAAFGIGSDIGGSLRIPTGYCGVYSLKPTKGRIPTDGSAKFAEGFEGIPVVYGPMGRSVRDVELLSSLAIDAIHPPPNADVQAADLHSKFGVTSLPVQPLRKKEFDVLTLAKSRGRPLRLGYYTHDGFSKPSPAVCRSMDEVVAALRAKHSEKELELIPVDPKDLHTPESLKLFVGLTSSDGYSGILAPLKGKSWRKDWLQSHLYLIVFIARAPTWIKAIFQFLLRFVIRDQYLLAASEFAGSKSTAKYCDMVAARDHFTHDFNERIWKKYRLDGIICPLMPTPAIPNGSGIALSPIAASTILYNVMDHSVAMVPVTRVDPARDSAVNPSKRIAHGSDGDGMVDEKALQKWQQWKNDPVYNESSKMINFTLYGEKKYDAIKMKGLPVSVQAVARSHEEEIAIGIAKLVDDALGPRGFAPGDFTKAHN